MTDDTLVDYFVMGLYVEIALTFIVAFYYSRKQVQKISNGIESEILNDLDNKMYRLLETAIAGPEPAYISNRKAIYYSPKEAYVFYIILRFI